VDGGRGGGREGGREGGGRGVGERGRVERLLGGRTIG